MQQTLAVGWFPEDEWSVALERWPDLLDELPRDHGEYLGSIEGRLSEMSARAVGVRLVMVPLTVAALDERAAQDGLDAGTPELRGRVASTLAALGEGTAWPPSRNDACWCGSGAKYKRCCAMRPRPAAVAPAGASPAADVTDG